VEAEEVLRPDALLEAIENGQVIEPPEPEERMQAATAKRLMTDPKERAPKVYRKGDFDQGRRAGRLNEKGINMALQLLIDKMFFEYCEGSTVGELARRHGFQERTIRFACSKHKWPERRRKMLLSIQAATADQHVSDQGTRARYFYQRHAAMLTAMTIAGENIIMNYAKRLAEKGTAETLSRDEERTLHTLNQCLHFVEKIGKAAAITFAPVQHGNIAFPTTGEKPPPIETKNVDGTSKVSWAMTGVSLPAGRVEPHGGLLDKQARTLDKLDANGVKVENKSLPGSV